MKQVNAAPRAYKAILDLRASRENAAHRATPDNRVSAALRVTLETEAFRGFRAFLDKPVRRETRVIPDLLAELRSSHTVPMVTSLSTAALSAPLCGATT